MKPRDTGILASRILAIFFGTQAISSLVSYLTSVARGAGALWPFVAHWSTLGLIALILWFGAGAIGGAIARGAGDVELGPVRPLAHVRGTAVFIVGLALVALALPELVVALSSAAQAGISSAGRSIAGPVVKLVIGVALMLYGGTTVSSAPTQTPAAPPSL